jgi:LPS-assembly protein
MIPHTMLVRLLLVSCLVCLAGAATARAQQAAEPEATFPSPNAFDQIRSKQGAFECEGTPPHCVYIDDVEMTLPGNIGLFADRVEFFGDENRLVASGNVVYSNPEGRIAADSVEFDIATNTGTFHVATGLMPLGAAADPAQFGSQASDIYFWGNTIEKLGARKYRVTRGGFTTCVQPTPRWELVTGSVVLNLDDYAVARHTVLRVKGVPVLYLPIVYYPIQDDNRATGFLLPTYGTSTLRGQALSNAFFWALGRSHDATFFHDWFTRTGQGAGVEYRYAAAAESAGNIRFYRLDQHQAEFTQNGQTQTLPAGKSFEFSGNMTQVLAPGLRARARLDYFSDVITQQLYHQDVYQASRNSRVIEGGISAALWRTSTNIAYQRSELLSSGTSATVYGSTPRVSTSVAPQRLFGTPVYASLNAEYAYLPNRSTTDGIVTRDDSHSRIDVTPAIRVPMSRLTFLSVNTSASYRTTRYSRRVGSTGSTIDEPYLRQYMALRSEVVGPVLTRIFDRPTSEFAERLKHVIEPAVTFDVTSRIGDYASTPVVSDVSDFVVSGAYRVTYGVTNRLFARSGADAAARGQTREFLTIGLQQTYYSSPESGRYDSAYQSSYGFQRDLDLSPVALTARLSPSAALDANLRVEYDVSGRGLQMLSAGGRVGSGATSTTMNYSRRRLDGGVSADDYLSTSTTMRWLDGRANGTYALSWDIGRSYVVSQSVVASYLAQCCGLQVEFQKFNYPTVIGIPIAADTRFNVGFILAGLGTFSNFFGALGGGR